MHRLLMLIFVCFLASCQEEVPLEENDSSIQQVREETKRSQNELNRLNKEIELEGKRQAREIEERVKNRQQLPE